MQKISPPPPFFAVLFTGGEAVSTPVSFSKLDTLYGGFEAEERHGDLPSFLTALASGDLSAMASSAYNIFENSVLSYCPLAKEALLTLRECGALVARMSGSGSAIFAVFATEAKAKRAAKRLGDRACVVRPII